MYKHVLLFHFFSCTMYTLPLTYDKPKHLEFFDHLDKSSIQEIVMVYNDLLTLMLITNTDPLDNCRQQRCTVTVENGMSQ